MDSPIIKIVIPARNEEDAIGPVVASVVKQVDAVIVADNGSTDSTAKVARDAGAIVVSVPEAGYGRACLAAIQALIWGHKFTDLGPFRAIRKTSYDQLNMQAPTFGWTVEMQVRALKHQLRCAEIPVHYRKRIGVSKISGTFRGVVLAGWYILGTIFIEAVRKKE